MSVHKSYLIQEVSVAYGTEYVSYITSDLLTALLFIAKVQSKHDSICAYIKHFSEIYYIVLSKSLTYKFVYKDTLPVDDPIVGNFRIRFTTAPYAERVTHYASNYSSPPICKNRLYCETCPHISACIMKNKLECVHEFTSLNTFTSAKFISLMRPYAHAAANRKKLNKIRKKVLEYLNNGYKCDFVYNINFIEDKFYMLGAYFIDKHGKKITFNDECFEEIRRHKDMSELYGLLNKNMFNTIKEDMKRWLM